MKLIAVSFQALLFTFATLNLSPRPAETFATRPPIDDIALEQPSDTLPNIGFNRGAKPPIGEFRALALGETSLQPIQPHGVAFASVWRVSVPVSILLSGSRAIRAPPKSAPV